MCTCSSNPGVGGTFSLGLLLFLKFNQLGLVHSLGNPKAAAHFAVDLQCWSARIEIMKAYEARVNAMNRLYKFKIQYLHARM